MLDLIVPPGDFGFVDLTIHEACTMLWMEESPYILASLSMSAQPCRKPWSSTTFEYSHGQSASLPVYQV